MRYPASEKLEIIRLVEQSHLSARRTLQKLGIPRSTFNRWYDRFLAGGVDALEDRRPRPNRVWNRIPDEVRDQLIDLALNEPELSPRELAVTFTDTKGYFVSESSVYRLLKVHDLITSPAFSGVDFHRDLTRDFRREVTRLHVWFGSHVLVKWVLSPFRFLPSGLSCS
jgi:putative transposase